MILDYILGYWTSDITSTFLDLTVDNNLDSFFVELEPNKGHKGKL